MRSVIAALAVDENVLLLERAGGLDYAGHRGKKDPDSKLSRATVIGSREIRRVIALSLQGSALADALRGVEFQARSRSLRRLPADPPFKFHEKRFAWPCFQLALLVKGQRVGRGFFREVRGNAPRRAGGGRKR